MNHGRLRLDSPSSSTPGMDKLPPDFHAVDTRPDLVWARLSPQKPPEPNLTGTDRPVMHH
jgi:hypothetical protein